MPASVPYIVNQSTTLVQFDTSDIALSPHIALLSSVNAPGSLITIRDLTGNASATNQIIVSTMQGQSFFNGNNLSSYTITQPYGFLTITPKTTQAWALMNTFAFPDSSAAANINTLTAVSITTSSLNAVNATISTAAISSLSVNNIYVRENISVGQSTIANEGFFKGSLRTLENMFVGNTVYAGSTISTITANVTSTLITPYISATTLDIRGVITTASTISTNGPLFVGSSISTTANLAVGGSTFIQGELRVQQNATFYSSISTLYRLDVGRETQLNSTLSVRDDALLYKNLSTVLNLNVGGALSVNSNLNVMGSTILNKTLLTFGEISSLSNVFINRNLSVAGDIAVGGNLNFGPTVRFSNIIASSLLANFFISTPSSIAAGTSLNVLGSTILTGPVSTLSNLNVAGDFNLNGAASLNSTLTVVSSISTTGNLTVSGVISTLKSVAVGDSLTVARSGLFGNNISTLSSIGVGKDVSIEGTLFVRSTISVIGTAAFYSSVQIQGSLSIFSSLAVAGSTFMQKVGIGGNIPTLTTDPSGNPVNAMLKVTGDLQLTGDLRDAFGNRISLTTVGGSPIPGINSAGSIGINKGSNTSYQFDVSGNTLIRGPLDVSGQANFVNSSNTGTLVIAGATTLNTLQTSGNVGLGVAPGGVRLSVTGDQSNIGNLNVKGNIYAYATPGIPVIQSAGNVVSDFDTSVGRDLSVGRNLTVGATGVTTLANTADNSLVINGGVWVKSKGIAFSAGTNDAVNGSPWYGIGWGSKQLGGGAVNSVQIAGYAGINFATGGGNQAYGSDMAIVGNKVGIANINPQATLDISGTMNVTGLATFSNISMTGDATFRNTSNTGTLGVAGTTTLSNTIIRGTLDVSGATTLSNTLIVRGATTLSNTLTVASGNATTLTGTLGVTGLTTLTGNVGIGKAPTANPLDVSGNAYATKFVGDLSGNATSATYALSPTPGINSVGTVGINKDSNTTYELDVSGDVRISATLGVSGDATFVNTINTGTTRLTGNVGIGKAPTANPLDVSGNAYATKFVGDLSGNATTATYALSPTPGINTTGNIGINKASDATYELDVSGDVRISATLGVAGLATFVNTSNTGTLGVAGLATFANTSNTGTLGVAGQATFVNTSNTGTLGVAGLATFVNTSNTGTLGVAGQATFVNTSNTGTLGVAGLARFVNTSNSGTLGVAGLTTLTGNVGIGKAPTSNALDVNGTVNATTFVGNLNGNATTATTATYAQSIISGGSLIPGINTPGSIIINSNSNKTYASARLYVDGNTIVSGDVTLRSEGAGTVIVGSNNATTSMSVNGTLALTTNLTLGTSGGTTSIFDGWGAPRFQWSTQYSDTIMIASPSGTGTGGSCLFYAGTAIRMTIAASGAISFGANASVTAAGVINSASLTTSGDITATGNITANKGWSISQLGVQLYTGTFTWSPSQSGGTGLTTTVIKSGTLPTLAAGNYYVEADVTAYATNNIRSGVDRFYVYFCSDTGGTTPIGMPAIFSLRDEYVSIIGNTSVYPVPTCRANTNLNGGSGYSIIITNQFGINGPTDDQWVVTVNARAISCGF